MSRKKLSTQVCIVGGGPGGAFLGLLLAKAGVQTLLLERAKDFNRDFRGESLSPDARQLLEINGLKKFISDHGYLESKALGLYDNGDNLMRFDFSQFDYQNKYVIEFPQPALLQGITEQASQYDNFTLMMGSYCKELIYNDNNSVCGIVAMDADKSELEIHCNLVVAADGRFSKMRKMAGLDADIQKSDRDVLWLKIPRPKNWPHEVKIKLKKDRHLIILPTFPDHLRLGVNIPDGEFRDFRAKGIEHLQNFIIDLEPGIEREVRETVIDWSVVALLDIFTARASKWYVDGLALLGDAAHTITPVMGQGIKHALFDALALRNIIVEQLSERPDALIGQAILVNYQAERQPETDFILQVQQRQEKIFCFSSVGKVLLRRCMYRLMNYLPMVKRALVKRVYFSGY